MLRLFLSERLFSSEIMIINKTKNRVLSENKKICKDIFSKSLGLMFQKYKMPLIFINKKEAYTPLHMWFVFYPIDVLYLNKNKKIIEMKQNFRPFSYYSPKKKAMYIVEIKEETIKRSGIKLGDVIDF